jgi:hypothetical protein
MSRKTALSLSLLALLAVIVAAYAGAKIYANNAAEKRVRKALKEVAGYANVSYEDVSVKLPGITTTINGVVLSRPGSPSKTRIDRIIIHDIDDEKAYPAFLHILLEGIDLEINEHNFGKDHKFLNDLGYDRIKASVEIDYRYRKKENEFLINTLCYCAENVGSITLQCHLGDIDLDFDDPMSVLLGIPTATLHSAGLIYEDRSLVKRLMDKTSRETGMDIDLMADKIVRSIKNDISDENHDITVASLKAIGIFLRDPQTISIFASPDTPVSLQSIQQLPQHELLNILNVRIEN